jgi:hypothetical protein
MRREFITLAGGAVTAWPLAAHAQQSKMPTIGFLSGRSLASDFHLAAAFRQGLKEIGHVEGQNLTIEFSRIPTGNICPARRTPGRRPIPISPKSANGRTAPTSSSSRTCNGPTTTRIPIATRIRNPAATQATRSKPASRSSRRRAARIRKIVGTPGSRMNGSRCRRTRSSPITRPTAKPTCSCCLT